MRMALVGAVREGWRCAEALLRAGYPLDALLTLTPERGQRLAGWVPWDALAAQYDVPLVPVPSINSPEAESALRDLAPDLLFVIGWTEIVKPHVLAIPTRGCIGMHASLLPWYRGSAPVNWCLIHGERETGNTMFWLTPGLDDGDIIAQRRIAISLFDTCGTLYEKVADAGIAMLLEHLPALLDNRAPRRPQQEFLPPMARRRPADGLIDWTKSPGEQYNWIRALTHPYPGAFTTWEGQTVFLWAARPTRWQPPARTAPGQVLGTRGRYLLVRTGDGVLAVARLQIAGQEECDGVAWFQQARAHGAEIRFASARVPEPL